MAIKRFDEVTGLFGYWNVAEPGTITVDGSDNVQSLAPGYSGVGETMVARPDRNYELKFDGSLIASCAAMYDDSTATHVSGLIWDGVSPPIDATAGLTYVVLIEPVAGTWCRAFAGNLGGTHDSSIEESSGKWRVLVNSTATVSTISVETSPTILIFRHGSAAGDTELSVEDHQGLKEAVVSGTAAPTRTHDRYYMLGASSGNLRGKMAFLAIYNRKISDAEKDDLLALCRVWRDTGSGPSTTPTTDSFGPVSTNQDGAVTSWKWQESANNSSWQDVGAILPYTSGQGTNTLTVDRATVAMHGTYVRCEAKTASQTTYSASAQVLIEGQ